jgi:hypothetical protein
MRFIQITGEEHNTAYEAIQCRNAAGWNCAIRVGGTYITTTDAEAQRLEAMGVEFAYLGDHCGMIMTVPVN